MRWIVTGKIEMTWFLHPLFHLRRDYVLDASGDEGAIDVLLVDGTPAILPNLFRLGEVEGGTTGFRAFAELDIDLEPSIAVWPCLADLHEHSLNLTGRPTDMYFPEDLRLDEEDFGFSDAHLTAGPAQPVVAGPVVPGLDPEKKTEEPSSQWRASFSDPLYDPICEACGAGLTLEYDYPRDTCTPWCLNREGTGSGSGSTGVHQAWEPDQPTIDAYNASQSDWRRPSSQLCDPTWAEMAYRRIRDLDARRQRHRRLTGYQGREKGMITHKDDTEDLGGPDGREDRAKPRSEAKMMPKALAEVE